MQLLICQSCGIVLRSSGKHCTSCGVPLAMNTPTEMPAFTQTRPPLEVSVKQDHLLVERVVNHRQLSVLGSARSRRPSYSSSSGSYQAQVPAGFSYSSQSLTPSRPLSEPPSNDNGGNGQGNGNGGNGQGHGNGNGHQSSASRSVSVSAPVEETPLKEPPQSPSLNEFGNVSIEDAPVVDRASGPSAQSSLMAALSNKGLIGQKKEQGQEQAQEKKDELLRQDDWSGSTSEKLDKIEDTNLPQPDSLKTRSSQDPTEKPAEVKKTAAVNLKSPFLAQGITGSAVSIAIGSAVTTARARPDKPFQSSTGADAGSPAVENRGDQSDLSNSSKVAGGSSSQSSVETSEVLDSVTSAKVSFAHKEQNLGTTVESDKVVSTTSGLASGAFPTEVLKDQGGNIVQNDKVSYEDNSGGSETVPQEEDSLPDEVPVATVQSGAVPPILGSNIQLGGIVANDKLNSPEFDFAEQFGTDFNPEAFFTGSSEPEPEVGAEFETLPIVEEPASELGVQESVPPKEAKQEVLDFFGDQGKQQIPSADLSTQEDSVAPGVSVSGGASSAGGFDFFDEPGGGNKPSRKPYIQDAELEDKSESVTVAGWEDSSDVKTTFLGGDVPAPEVESSTRPMVALSTGSKTKTVDKEKIELVPHADESSPEENNQAEDEDSEEQQKSPKRRSFSGGSIAPKQPKKTSKREVEDVEDHEDDEDDDEDDQGNNGQTWLEQEVSLGGLNVSRQTAIVLVSVGAFILIQVPGWIMAFVGVIAGGGGPTNVASNPPGMQQQQQAQMPGQQMPGGMMPGSGPGQNSIFRHRNPLRGGPAQAGPAFPTPGGGQLGGPSMQQQPTQPGMQQQPGAGQGQQAPMPSVGGQWQIVAYGGQTPYPARVQLEQRGETLSGYGTDQLGGFTIAGAVYAPDRIEFNKAYDAEAKKKGALTSTITFTGQIGQKDGHIVAQGAYRSTRKVGYEQSIKNPAHMITISDKWNGVQISQQQEQKPQGFQMPDIGGMFAPKSVGGQHTPQMGHKDPKSVQQFFMSVALGLIGVGVLIFLFFLMLFGPSGKMNIWEKKKYIPSQFKSQHMKMVREMGKPLSNGSVPLGKRLEWGWWSFWTPKALAMPLELREKNPHMLLLGGSDKGKTRLMAKMISHDIKSEDRAIVVIDSDGSLSELIIHWIASQPDGKKYAKRVVLVDPTYSAGSLAYNPLEMPEDGDLQAAASAIVHGFKAIYTEPPGQQGGGQNQWNQQTANILRNATLLLMANGRTLTDLPNLLQDNDFRDIMLETVERRKAEKTEYINIIDTWNQYKKLARTDQWINWVEPILNRVGPMLGDGRIRPILTKPVSDLKLKQIILDKKILIVKVPQGELDQNANLLGSLMVTGLQQAAMSLGRERPHDIRPAALYLDDMDGFIEKETVEQLTAETKRYQIGFVGSVKTLQNLPEDFKSQLIINVGTMCVFALAKKDGDLLGPQMFRVDGRKIKHQTITNFFNKVNTSPQFELIMDEEKLNIDRIVGQEEQTYFCYRVGTVAGVFKLKAYDFKDVPRDKLDTKLIEKMHAITDNFSSGKKSD